jgi:hypothetical protein
MANIPTIARSPPRVSLQRMVHIAQVFQNLKCLDFLHFKNPDFLMATISMVTPLVGISPVVYEDLTPSQLLQIRRLSGICSRSNGSDPNSYALLLSLNSACLHPIQWLSVILCEHPTVHNLLGLHLGNPVVTSSLLSQI